MPDTTPVIRHADPLADIVRGIFRAVGSSEREADLIARHLVEANLKGHDSHGVGMVPGYLKGVRLGLFHVNQTLKVTLDQGSLLLVNGGMGAGQVMAHDAMALGIAKAKQLGVALVGLADSYHIGRIGHWAEQSVAAGLVSLHYVNVPGHAAVAAHNGLSARLGTNPFAAGFPRAGADPIIVDYATSRWAVGKVRVAKNKGVSVPDGLLLDADGRPTNDPNTIFDDPAGAILPFGEHKGFGLSMACEILAGALTAGTTQTGAHHEAIINCMLAIIIDPAKFAGDAAYTARLEALTGWVTGAEKAGPSAVLLPGAPERATKAERLRNGIPIDPVTWEEIRVNAIELGAPASLFDGAP